MIHDGRGPGLSRRGGLEPAESPGNVPVSRRRCRVKLTCGRVHSAAETVTGRLGTAQRGDRRADAGRHAMGQTPEARPAPLRACPHAGHSRPGALGPLTPALWSLQPLVRLSSPPPRAGGATHIWEGEEARWEARTLPSRRLSSKESACRAGDERSIPGSGRFPWSRKWQPTPVFLPGQSQEQSILQDYSPWRHSQTRPSS